MNERYDEHRKSIALQGYSMGLIPTNMLTLGAFSEPRFKLAALLVRMTQPNFAADQLKQLAGEAAALLDPPAEPDADRLVFSTAEAHLDRNPVLREFLLELSERMPVKVSLGISNCERLLRHVLRSRPSTLQTLQGLQRLQLPVIQGG